MQTNFFITSGGILFRCFVSSMQASQIVFHSLLITYRNAQNNLRTNIQPCESTSGNQWSLSSLPALAKLLDL